MLWWARTDSRHDIPTTFFRKGINVLHHGGIHRNSAGLHELANHTWDHPDLARLDYHARKEQIERTSTIMAQVYGTRPTLSRPPTSPVHPCWLQPSNSSPRCSGTHRPWRVVFRDRPAGIVASVRTAVQPGSIILGTHTGLSDRLIWIEHLDAFIRVLRADGLTFTPVSKLCRLG